MMLNLMSDIFFMIPKRWSDAWCCPYGAIFWGVLLILSNTRFAPDGAIAAAKHRLRMVCRFYAIRFAPDGAIAAVKHQLRTVCRFYARRFAPDGVIAHRIYAESPDERCFAPDGAKRVLHEVQHTPPNTAP